MRRQQAENRAAPHNGNGRAGVTALVLALAYGTGLVLLRQGLGIGWGDLDGGAGDRFIPLGLAHGVPDNLSYVAWAMQARQGAVPFIDLFTTEAHEALLVVPLFWLVGKIAALLAVHPLWLMNVLTPVSAALAVWGVYGASGEMGLTVRARLLAMGFTAFGAGLSVPLLLLSSGAAWSQGADTHYFDLFPATIFPFYPYQSIGLAAIVLLLFLCLRAERARPDGASAGLGIAAVFFAAVLAICIRPYEPLAFVIVYAIYTAASFATVTGRSRARRRLLILVAMLAAIVPLTVYYYWVSTQPVWNAFADASLDLEFGRWQWLIGFGLFWPAAAWAIVVAAGDERRHVGLIATWAGFLFLLLVVLNVAESKLAGGGFIALAILTGFAVDRLFAAAGRLRPAARGLCRALLLILVASTALSPLQVLTKDREATEYFALDPEVVAAADKAGMAAGGPVAVLTDQRTGSVLPALAGHRVYAGHWSLTLNHGRKTGELLAAGFEEESSSETSSEDERRLVLDRIRAAAQFDFVLVRRDRPAYPLLDADPTMQPVYQGERWVLFRIGPS